MASNPSSQTTAVALFPATTSPSRPVRVVGTTQRENTLPAKLISFTMTQIENMITQHQKCLENTNMRLRNTEKLSQQAYEDLVNSQSLQNKVLLAIDDNNINIRKLHEEVYEEEKLIGLIKKEIDSNASNIPNEDLDNIYKKYNDNIMKNFRLINTYDEKNKSAQEDLMRIHKLIRSAEIRIDEYNTTIRFLEDKKQDEIDIINKLTRVYEIKKGKVLFRLRIRQIFLQNRKDEMIKHGVSSTAPNYIRINRQLEEISS
jgi:hypothetical protein